MGTGNTIVFLVVGLVVGAAAGFGIGYFLYNEEDPATTYWFYIDHNGGDGDNDDMWISSTGDSPLDAMIKAFEKNEIDHDVGDDGWISSLDGLNSDSSLSWMSFLWTKSNFDTQWPQWATTPGFNVTIGEVFYLVLTAWNFTTNEPVSSPSLTDKWMGEGPFAVEE